VADLVIRAAADNDIPAILDTLRAALGESPVLRRTPELWAWKHVLNPFGPSFVFVAVAGGGRIAGVRAMMRWRLVTHDGDVLTCVRPVDTATHPQYERRGIFRRLTMTALDTARAEGVHLVFNTPNDKSGPGYLRMGWKEVGQIGVLVRPRFGRAVRPATSQPPSIASWAPGAVTVPASSMSQDREPRGLRTPRSEMYATWRFLSHPSASYGWVSDGVSSGLIARAGERAGRSELVISDLVGSPHSNSIRAIASMSRARYLAGWFSRGTPERRAALQGGLLPVPGVKPLRLLALPLSDLDTDVHDLSSWDLSTSDLELL
jgi:GNAT superfamily N-acetyltransferase